MLRRNQQRCWGRHWTAAFQLWDYWIKYNLNLIFRERRNCADLSGVRLQEMRQDNYVHYFTLCNHWCFVRGANVPHWCLTCFQKPVAVKTYLCYKGRNGWNVPLLNPDRRLESFSQLRNSSQKCSWNFEVCFGILDINPPFFIIIKIDFEISLFQISQDFKILSEFSLFSLSEC